MLWCGRLYRKSACVVLGRTKKLYTNIHTDQYLNYLEKMQRYIDDSWAPKSYDQVTCKVNQDRFSVLYSDNLPPDHPLLPLRSSVR